MNINGLIKVCDEIELNEDTNFIKSVVSKLGKMSWDAAKKFLKQKAQEFVAFIKDDPYIDDANVLRIINTRFGTTFSSTSSVFAKALVENTNRVDEGLKEWWKEASGNFYGAISFYPLLTAFLEMDKVIKGTGDANVRTMAIYFLIWVLIISGKVISGQIGKPGEEKETGAVVNPRSWKDILMRKKAEAV